VVDMEEEVAEDLIMDAVVEAEVNIYVYMEYKHTNLSFILQNV
jgi:hypothetical protein